ncbi:MAG TPA: DEAD/DEAH box helicase [Steroidobacteraceae bacterium]|nr:DEAD/DEAH box helicase [Steroidobacteraceae bacterium]
MKFSDLGLAPGLVAAVTEKGYSTPTPIQQAAIPAVLSGRDVLAGAQTGTGKTAGFVLPILQRLGARKGHAPRALILTPTRELAAQVAESVRDYGKNTDLRSAVIFGGVSERPQIEAMRRGCDILIATPGRLLDLAEQKAVSLAEVAVFVLDEADRMLDMGFIHAIKRVRALLPKERQNLLFSATYSDDIRRLVQNLLRDPLTIEVAPPNRTADKVEQVSYRLPKDHKRHLLAHLINEGNWHQVLVFTRTKHGANRLAEHLSRTGIAALPIHGNKSQNARVRALNDFKDNRIVALVATEVAARGLDIKELPYVVNYELPNVPEDYVHRIGRTARAGSTGQAISLVSPDEAPFLKDIVKLLGKDIPSLPLPAFAVSEPAPRPAQQGQGQPQQGQRQDQQRHRRPEQRAGQHQRSRNRPQQGRWSPRSA